MPIVTSTSRQSMAAERGARARARRGAGDQRRRQTTDGRLRHTHRRTFRGGLRARRSPPPPLSSLKAASGTFLSQLPRAIFFHRPIDSIDRSPGLQAKNRCAHLFRLHTAVSTPAWLAGDHRDDGDGRSRRRAGGSQPASVASVLYYIVALGRRRVDDRGRQTSELTPEFP